MRAQARRVSLSLPRTSPSERPLARVLLAVVATGCAAATPTPEPAARVLSAEDRFPRPTFPAEATLTGQFVTPKGDFVPGDLVIRGPDGFSRAMRTRGDGFFRVDGLPPWRNLELEFSAELGAPAFRRTVLLPGLGEHDLRELKVSDPRPLEVEVVAKDGSPLDAARVDLVQDAPLIVDVEDRCWWDPAIAFWTAAPGESLATGPDGGLHLAVSTGDWRLVVSAPGKASTILTIPAEKRPSGVAFRLAEGFRLSGRMLAEDGAPLQGVTVLTRRVAHLKAGSAGPYRSTTDAEGRYSLEGLHAGRYRILVADPSLAVRTVAKVALSKDGELDLRLGPVGSVDILALDAHGGPLRGAEVKLEVAESWGWDENYAAFGVTGEDGRARFSNVPIDGVLRAIVSKEGWGWRWGEHGGAMPPMGRPRGASRAPGSLTELVEILPRLESDGDTRPRESEKPRVVIRAVARAADGRRHPGLAVAGRIVTTDGSPPGRVELRAVWAGIVGEGPEIRPGFRDSLSKPVSPDGTFFIDGLDAGYGPGYPFTASTRRTPVEGAVRRSAGCGARAA